MDADEPVDAVGLQGAVNLVQGDLFWRAGEDGARCTWMIPAFFRALSRLRITTGLQPVLCASMALVTRTESAASYI